MNSNFFEKNLLNYFSDVLYVDTNPATLKYENVYKRDGKLNIEKGEKIINLESMLLFDTSQDLMSPECRCSGIIDHIKTKSPSIKYNYYPKNILKYLFSNKEKNLLNFLKSKLSNDNYIITSYNIGKLIENKIENKIYKLDSIDEYFQERLHNKIIIGVKKTIYLMKDYHKIKNFESVEVFYFTDSSNFLVIDLV